MIHLLECRGLKVDVSTARRTGFKPNPFAEITVFGERRLTEIESTTSSVLWDRQFVFRSTCTPYEFNRAELSIKLWHANVVLRDELIGQVGSLLPPRAAIPSLPSLLTPPYYIHYIRTCPQFTFGVEKVNKITPTPFDSCLQRHGLFRKWLALSNPAAPSSEHGYLRLSISVLRGDDVPSVPPPNVEDNDEVGGLHTTSASILLPPTIRPRRHAVHVRLYWADDLPQAQMAGSVGDAFVVVRFNGHTMRSETRLDEARPVWNQEFSLPVQVRHFYFSLNLVTEYCTNLMHVLINVYFWLISAPLPVE